MKMTPHLTGFVGVVRVMTRYWALLGGVFIFSIVALNVYSVAQVMLFDRPFPGVYELVQMGVAMGMFMFLPYCQISGSNVTADIFTANLGKNAVAALGGLGALFALALSILLLWRMYLGFGDMLAYGETTAIYQIPLWYAYVPILMSLVLMAFAAMANLVQARQGIVPHEVESA
ncbi:TRAP transporter small permease [Pelagibacterium sp.]|uniref:TRAP transporter small permease n=1 Tax=Pelagibacterium sp. TaxID=1967288 RepID=UPI003A8E6641